MMTKHKALEILLQVITNELKLASVVHESLQLNMQTDEVTIDGVKVQSAIFADVMPRNMNAVFWTRCKPHESHLYGTTLSAPFVFHLIASVLDNLQGF